MKILIVGSGGREDALAWALSRGPGSRTVRVAPGNGGTRRHGERVPIGADSISELVEHARDERYDLVVVGPEAPLVLGLADRLREHGVPVFGPSAAAARIEGSKAFAKEFLARHGIPTAEFRLFTDVAEARRYLGSSEARYPLVVKADGLAAGKGVILADDRDSATAAAEGMLTGGLFGEAGSRIVIEERLHGREASFFVLSDGERFVELATCQDYKRVGNGDSGPNTGGMGTYSPSAWLDDGLRERLRSEIVRPTIEGLAAEGRPYRGVLYVGVMLTDHGPRVLEYNARFGDPETQVLLPRLEGDWAPLLLASAEGMLAPGATSPAWRPDPAVCVVMAAGGYPGSYRKGLPIAGLDEAERLDGVHVFHAGTELDEGGDVVTGGGRVLGVTALGRDLAAARDLAYDAVQRIGWDGEQHRRDIALDALQSGADPARPAASGAEAVTETEEVRER